MPTHADDHPKAQVKMRVSEPPAHFNNNEANNQTDPPAAAKQSQRAHGPQHGATFRLPQAPPAASTVTATSSVRGKPEPPEVESHRTLLVLPVG